SGGSSNYGGSTLSGVTVPGASTLGANDGLLSVVHADGGAFTAQISEDGAATCQIQPGSYQLNVNGVPVTTCVITADPTQTVDLTWLPSDPPDEGQGAIAINVTSEEQPVESVILNATNGSGYDEYALTGANGKAVLFADPGQYDVTATPPPQYATPEPWVANIERSGQQVVWNLELQRILPTGRLTVLVVNAETGEKIVDAIVRLDYDPTIFEFTNADGEAVFNEVVTGRDTVSVNAYGYEPREGVPVDIHAGGDANVTVELTPVPDGDISVQVLDLHSGDPIGSARVEMINMFNERVMDTENTDEDGRAVFTDIPAGVWMIRCSADGYAEQNVPAESISGDENDITINMTPITPIPSTGQ
ncbi:MAG: carboxypeptidase-like regulatory domain-containing protein, partial [Negativicutes bacterium]|nr:carboxypeptidase-like regulatory domain-containing protein [Negativicutes bacterium]